MEQNVQLMARKVWHIVSVAFFMLRKSITKKKLLLDLKYLTLRRSKLAGKILAGKLTHHHHHNHNHHPPGGAYEFSCSNTPNHHFPYHFPLLSSKSRALHDDIKFDPHALTNCEDNESETDTIKKVLEMMSAENAQDYDIEASPYPHQYQYPFLYSPVLPGFGYGQSPVVRVTDSPYPVLEGEVESHQVDEAAEEFIQRFYAQLNQQMIACA